MRKIWLLLGVVGFVCANAQPLLHFRNVQGLSQQMVYNLHVDAMGFLWIATSDGLNRYDGSTMRVYRPENDSHVPGIGGCIICSRILEDSTGNLWLSTENGVYRFSPQTETFTPVVFPEKGGMQKIASEPVALIKGDIWFYNGQKGLFCYTPATKSIRNFGLPKSTGKELIFPVGLHFDGAGFIYAATRHGVFRFGLATGRWENDARLSECRSLIVLRDTLYVAYEKGVQYLCRRTGMQGMVPFSEKATPPVRCFYADANGNLWAGDNGGGIWRRHTHAALWERAGFPGRISGTPNGFSVYTLNGINGRTLFAGGDVFGLKVADLHKPVFANYPSANAPFRTSPVFITAIAGHRDGTVYAGTMGEGFIHKPRGTDTFSPLLRHPFPNGASPRTGAFNDEKGNTWLASGSNLVLLNHRGNTAQRYRLYVPPDAAYSSITVNSISAFDGYWIAATNCGLFKIFPNRVQYVASFGINNTHCLWQENDTALWIGTEAGGIVITHPERLEANGRQLLAGATVKHLMPDTAHRLLWVSTTNGLVAVTPPNGAYRVYGEKDGLPNNYCYGTLLHHKDLWLSTNKGISRLSLQFEGANPLPHFHVASFTAADGLPADECNSRSFYAAPDGYLYFGSIAGLTWFNPAGLHTDIPPPKTILTGCLVNGKPADTATAAPWLKQLRLNWRQNEITFQVGVLEYINTVPIEYAIQLKGYDSIPWQMSGQELVRYTNLPAGQYTFVAKARGNGGAWGEAAALHILIAAPFWKRWWFMALSVFLMVGAGAAVSFVLTDRKMKLQALEIEKQRELEKERQRISREMHDDIGAGLTRITLMADRIARKQEGLGEVKGIADTSRKLVGSMREIIWTLNPENSSMERLLAYLRETFFQQLEYSGIAGHIIFPETVPHIMLNNEQLHHIILVCREAVNNAVCHSGCRNIQLQCGVKQKQIWFRVQDDGSGFAEEDVKHGNGLRNMRSRITELGGGFALETGGKKGTGIWFSVPLLL